jgi:hypothetical protein
MAEPLKKPLKKREEWDKAGKYVYIVRKIQDLRRDVLHELKSTNLTLKYMIKGLEHEFQFDRVYIEEAICGNEVDRNLLSELHTAGSDGLLPRDLAKRLTIKGTRRSKPQKVTTRIHRLNRRLDALLGKKAAEKAGMAWTLTDFMQDAWGSTKQELDEEKEVGKVPV